MAVKWRDIRDEKPRDGQECLTRMKHGMIEGYYDKKEDEFTGYYYQDMTWYATQWIPVEELQ